LEGHQTGDGPLAQGDRPAQQPSRLPKRAIEIEAKLTQQLAHIEQAPFYGVFIDLKKVFDAINRERCLFILEGHGIDPSMRRLIHHFWDEATNVCCASGNYGTPFKMGRGVTADSAVINIVN
jgi:hypothetical protein